MNKPKKNYFFPENEYTRYVIGRFSNEEFVPRMLEEYSNLASDSPICTNLVRMLAFVTCPFFVFQQKNPQNTQERHPQKEG